MQLVGQLCIHCQQRIPSELDGVFCSLCGAPAHTECVQKAILTPPEGGCRVCGAPRAVVKALRSAVREQERVAESTAQLHMAMVGVLLVITGVLFSLLYSVFVASGASRFVAPTGVILAGIGLIIAGLRRQRR